MDTAAETAEGKRASPPGALRSPGGKPLRTHRGVLFELAVGFENQLADAVLRRGIAIDGAQQRKRPSLTVDDILAGGKGDVATVARAALPHGEAYELQSLHWSVGEMHLRVSELARGDVL